ncbi:hypothetical protein [Gallibacterium genomosp. 3]|uniref:hypothetical protein n=1 Tax=Gallibacterium genomosp. 3 TaxID=505345 RepID=UPI00080265C2|nr:hypothetical protein [Gallibacterium genomosp. 3]
MGYGGILAAMAAGLGTGIVKNVENGWKEEAAQKEMDWRSKEAALNRQHDFDLEDKRYQNEISKMAVQAQYKIAEIKYQHQLTNNSQDKKDEDVTNGMDAKLKVVDNLKKAIANLGDVDEDNPTFKKLQSELKVAEKEVEIYRDSAAYQDVYNRAPAGMKAEMETKSGIKSAGYKQWEDNESKRIEQEKIKTEQENTARQQTQEVARQKAAQRAEEARVKFGKSFNSNPTSSGYAWANYYNSTVAK